MDKRLPSLLFLAAVYAQPEDLFTGRVRPVLVERCATCHGTPNKLSGFDITTRDGLLKGGKHGGAIIPGKASESRLYQWIASGKMPPGKPLEPEQIRVIGQWIDAGAKWDIAENLTAGAQRAGVDWWAFQPLREPEIPQIPGLTNPIDAFLLVKLREKGLDFAPEADARTLSRRISFDLIGLPPEPGLMNLTYEQQIDRSLASHHYGERWGRHWLDVVRFGETDGGEHNNERFNAWKYRDYVIDAFNQDQPYNRFILEQIAGDVLAPNNPKIVAATGFLTAGPWDSVTKELNKDDVLRKTIRMDELDDMVTTTFATFQALSVNCARCHDHKFDPIPTRDYYRLTAVFNGAGFGEREIATVEQRSAREAAIAPLEKRLGAIRREIGLIENPVRTRLLLARYQEKDAATAKDPRRIPLNPIWNRNSFSPVRAARFRLAITGASGKRARIDKLELLPVGRIIENWQAQAEATPDQPVYLEVTFDEPVTVSEIRWSSDRINGQNNGTLRVYRFEAEQEGGRWTTLCSSLNHIDFTEVGLPQVSDKELEAAIPPAALEKRRSLTKERAAMQSELETIAPIEKIYGVVPEPLTASHVLLRGSPATPGEEVTPGALSTIRMLSPDLESAASDEGTRRLALARWITGEKNPLTARVIVNRVWQFHFGSGIVNTPSDFGFNGDRPSHSELLDYLAASFVKNGWSLKWLHRQILNSRAYRQASTFSAKANGIDMSNRLLWRMPLRRMDAETLRDSILWLTGSLNPERGGPGFFLQKKVDRASYIHKAVDDDGPAVWRRSVYRFVVRGGERIFMDSFDCPDPAVATPQRTATNTAVQALTLLNNPFVLRQAGLLAERLEREAGGQREKQIERAYSLLFDRPPNAKEMKAGMLFLTKQPLTIYCRALLNTNEFVYVP